MKNTSKLDATVKRTIKSLAEGIIKDLKRVWWDLQNERGCKQNMNKIELKAKKIMESADSLYQEKDDFYI